MVMPLRPRRCVASTRALARGGRLVGARGALQPPGAECASLCSCSVSLPFAAPSHVEVITLQCPPLHCARRCVPTALSPRGSQLCRAAVLALPLPRLIPSSPPSRNASAQGLPYATLLSPCAVPLLRATLTSVIYLSHVFLCVTSDYLPLKGAPLSPLCRPLPLPRLNALGIELYPPALAPRLSPFSLTCLTPSFGFSYLLYTDASQSTCNPEPSPKPRGVTPTGHLHIPRPPHIQNLQSWTLDLVRYVLCKYFLPACSIRYFLPLTHCFTDKIKNSVQ